MSDRTFILAITMQYLLGASYFIYDRNWPLAITYFGYALGNVGLLWLTR